MAKHYRIAVVGATTTAGKEIVTVLGERDFPAAELIPLATQGSLGSTVQYRDEEIPVQTIKKTLFQGVDIAFFASTEKISKEYAPGAAKQGCTVIDTTPCFRMDEGVPLVVPEINAHRISGNKGIIASPCPAAVQAALVLGPIHRAAVVLKVVLSTYQAVSDMGDTALEALTEQIADLFNFRETRSSVFPHQMAFNVIPQVGPFLDNAYTSDEMRIAEETKKVLESSAVRISATMVLVPMYYCHSQSVNIQTVKKLSPDKVRSILKHFPGIRVEDNPAAGIYPLPVYVTGKDECFVGRIREDLSTENGIALWSVSDNIRKGTAINAVRIAEHLISINR
ncbi:MAG: aspartate-semialdehyde dehydrogenase [Deltaproteobacteria bacterium]|nr:aspartate-semialdehyde dehydrogenase [Deltaproteobacteria bacterium]